MVSGRPQSLLGKGTFSFRACLKLGESRGTSASQAARELYPEVTGGGPSPSPFPGWVVESVAFPIWIRFLP